MVETRAAFCPAPCGEDEEGDGRQEGERDADESEDEGETTRKCPQMAVHGWRLVDGLGRILRVMSAILGIYFCFSDSCGFLIGIGEMSPAAGLFLGFCRRFCAALLIWRASLIKEPVGDVVPDEAADGAQEAPDAFGEGERGGGEEGVDLAEGLHGFAARVW